MKKKDIVTKSVKKLFCATLSNFTTKESLHVRQKQTNFAV